jgi:hypothetical protein
MVLTFSTYQTMRGAEAKATRQIELKSTHEIAAEIRELQAQNRASGLARGLRKRLRRLLSAQNRGVGKDAQRDVSGQKDPFHTGRNRRRSRIWRKNRLPRGSGRRFDTGNVGGNSFDEFTGNRSPWL